MTPANAALLLQELIASGKIVEHVVACGECGRPMKLVGVWAEDGALGIFYGCSGYPDSCKSTHGAHADGTPYGIPGDAATRAARIRAHDAFDRLWKGAPSLYDLDDLPDAQKPGKIRSLQALARRRAYAWLADRMKLPPESCHIGAFDVVTCELVAMLCARSGPSEVRTWAKASGIAPGRSRAPDGGPEGRGAPSQPGVKGRRLPSVPRGTVGGLRGGV